MTSSQSVKCKMKYEHFLVFVHSVWNCFSLHICIWFVWFYQKFRESFSILASEGLPKGGWTCQKEEAMIQPPGSLCLLHGALFHVPESGEGCNSAVTRGRCTLRYVCLQLPDRPQEAFLVKRRQDLFKASFGGEASCCHKSLSPHVQVCKGYFYSKEEWGREYSETIGNSKIAWSFLAFSSPSLPCRKKTWPWLLTANICIFCPLIWP